MFPPDYVRQPTAADRRSTDRGRLHLLVLEGGHALLARARAALAEGDAHAFAADLRRTQDVVLELVRMLDRNDGADTAAHLERLHDLMVTSLALATAERSLDRVDEMLRTYGAIVEAHRAVVERVSAPGRP